MNEMNQQSQDKSVVYYIGVPEFYNWNGQPDQVVARLQHVINHPKLGSVNNVRTSLVEKVLEDGTIFTRNTIYKPLATEEMGS
jgi:hypothetical protein